MVAIVNVYFGICRCSMLYFVVEEERRGEEMVLFERKMECLNTSDVQTRRRGGYSMDM